ncbi:CAP domain-containing protein [Demequina zhanjiangensis]|uniref:Cysteine-rich secretory protein family protein n=1 Tax=Demequina zhanjiangensis TaxID=3051659 RepID=A0ABT8G3J1_9MICO|nr:hypothetical protein [Demequina sp. SYSU T00b26]MDN4473693.1 hypothetical protein [Demequina sp. SYSU T00b26]
MTVTRRRLVVGSVIALAITAGLVFSAVAQHRAEQELQASIEALDPLRAECREARAHMREEQVAASEALETTTLTQDIAEVDALAATLDEAVTLDLCDMGPGDSVEANEDVATWLSSTRASAEMIQDALAGGQEALAAAEADAAAARAAESYGIQASAAEAAAKEARALLAESAGAVVDATTVEVLRATIRAVEDSLAVQPADDADAAWFEARERALADATELLESRSDAVEESHAAWEKAQATARSAPSSSGTSGSGSSTGSSSGSGSSPSVTYAKGSAAEFCAVLNAARTSNGVAAFSRCGESSSQVAHAQDMARSGSIWHTGGENIVGYAGSMSSLMSAFMGSSQHRDLILSGGSPASVGCYWRHESRTSEVFCSAAFSF